MKYDYTDLADQLTRLLKLHTPPLAITFGATPPAGVSRYSAPMASPAGDGRRGPVPAGCVFWMKAATDTFATVKEDHGNCSVGSLTHGFLSLEEAAGHGDVAALVESDWVTLDAVPHIPAVKEKPGCITYGPLAVTPTEPDVVLLRVNAKQAMVLADALPGLRFEGKPQCHIIAIAKEQGQPAVSVGCMLSRVRTGMPNTEMTCALPAARLGDIVASLVGTCAADNAVAAYASADARRFAAT